MAPIEEEDPGSTRWHIDRRIPIAVVAPIVVAVVVQTVAIIWSYATLTQRVTALEEIVGSRSNQLERVIRLEERVVALQETARRIEELVRRNSR